MGVNALDEFLDKKVVEARAAGKTEDWIKGMTNAFNRYRSDKKENAGKSKGKDEQP